MFCSWVSLLCHLIKASEATVMSSSLYREVCVEFEMIIPHLQVGDAKQCLCYQRTRNYGIIVPYPHYTTFLFPVSPNKPWIILCTLPSMQCILFHYYLCSVTIQFLQPYENIPVEWSASLPYVQANSLNRFFLTYRTRYSAVYIALRFIPTQLESVIGGGVESRRDEFSP